MIAEYAVRDRMGVVVASYDDSHDAGKHMSRLDPGAFVAKGSTILKWHVGTSKPMEREIRKLIGWPEPAPEFVPSKPTGFAFGAKKNHPRVTAPVVTTTKMETSMATTKPIKCRGVEGEPECNESCPKSRRPEYADTCQKHRNRLYVADSLVRLGKASKSKRAPKTATPKRAPKRAAKAPQKPVRSPKPAKRDDGLDDYTLADAVAALAIVERLGGIERADALATALAAV